MSTQIPAIAQILNGELDDALEALHQAVRLRQQLLAQRMTREIEPGQRLRFRSSVRPTYLKGREVIVRRINRSTLTVDLIQPIGRFATNIRTSASLLEVIPKEAVLLPKRIIRKISEV
jgi:hypothetical protein